MQPETLFPKGNATGFCPSGDWHVACAGCTRQRPHRQRRAKAEAGCGGTGVGWHRPVIQAFRRCARIRGSWPSLAMCRVLDPPETLKPNPNKENKLRGQ